MRIFLPLICQDCPVHAFAYLRFRRHGMYFSVIRSYHYALRLLYKIRGGRTAVLRDCRYPATNYTGIAAPVFLLICFQCKPVSRSRIQMGRHIIRIVRNAKRMFLSGNRIFHKHFPGLRRTVGRGIPFQRHLMLRRSKNPQVYCCFRRRIHSGHNITYAIGVSLLIHCIRLAASHRKVCIIEHCQLCRKGIVIASFRHITNGSRKFHSIGRCIHRSTTVTLLPFEPHRNLSAGLADKWNLSFQFCFCIQ